MPLAWKPFVDLVGAHSDFLLTTHVRPDGDALGSMLAVGLTLEQLGKRVRMVVASLIPSRYDFLDPDRRVQRFELPGDSYRDAEAVIVLDTGTWNQIGDFGTFLRELKVPRLVIDHHVTQDDLGGVRLVDTTAEAAGRLAREAIASLNVPLTPTVAQCLFVALAMDTGWFRHQNTTSRTYALASELVEAGAKPTAAYERLYEETTIGRLGLMSLVLGRIQLTEGGRVCYTHLLKDDYLLTGAKPQESEDLVNFTRSVAGVEVGLFFMEQPKGGIKVSFRSRERIDVAAIASRFGGGGHRLASGATLDMNLDEARQLVLTAVSAALDASS